MRRPDGAVRRSQILTSAGPGSLVDLVNDAVIIGGLDTWRYTTDQSDFIIEPRLQIRAQKLLSAMSWWSHPEVRLRSPPACDDNKVTRNLGIQAARFPGWYLCQNNSCRSLVNWRGLNEHRKHTCSDTTSRRGMPVVPVRFVSACPNGHIQDIDWLWFVHRGKTEDGVEQESGQPRRYCTRKGPSQRPNDPLGDGYSSALYLIQVGTSGELADYVVGCRDCGMIRGLQELNTPAALGKCPGHRPWLGDAREANCSQATQIRLLTRTASNAYFAQTLSVLSIPDPDTELREKVEEVWTFIQGASREFLGMCMTNIPAVQKVLGGYMLDDVWEEVDRRQQGRPVDIPKTRETEWKALMSAPPEAPGERPSPDQVWFARKIPTPDAPDFLDRVVLVHHLREVRAQIGFTRLESVTGDAEGDYDLSVTTAPLGLDASWIPAVEILGEGVFLAFSREAIEAWESRIAVIRRREKFTEALFEFNQNRKNPVLFPQPIAARLLMLHTLSHMLINAISLECGYPATSIRERIYCSHGGDGEWRAGILLYTGTPGSEGTLGGLVEVGRNILHHLRRAAEMGLLCSNDPVCAQHEPHGSEEGREREGAACHGCVLIGEPSCERMNRDLDRTFVVPTVEESEVAFLRDWVRSWSG